MNFIFHRKITRMNKLFLSLSLLLFINISCKQAVQKNIEAGVSYQLAQQRYADISDLSYLLEMDIPDSLQQPVMAKSTLLFNKNEAETDLVLDFITETNEITLVQANDQKVFFKLENEHLIIPGNYLKQGDNKIEIAFRMGERALNRNEDYLYTLFVPDRARTVLPCFDQPDIKARMSYSIKMPADWIAITNGQADFTEIFNEGRKLITYASTKPISSYLWAVAAGKFTKVTANRKDFGISVYHMESDTAVTNRNMSQIFDQVYHSIDWLEQYTRVEFPFQKYDLVCIPSFQFAGMEHPGAVYYRQEMLFLAENPTQKELLNRAQLLAHETSHMWFGDLVTMKWFSGVWQKEVFANFIADKIVEEKFTDLNNELTFLINHFPASFAVDRTIAANPIQQKLNNLSDAASMYGNIIYHKAPIVMNQLEELMGDELLREGLSRYLKKYSYSNATWADLMKLLNDLSEYDLELWSNNWVNEPGRPVVEFVWENEQLLIKQKPEYGDSSKVWAQRLNCSVFEEGKQRKEMLEFLSPQQVVTGKKPDFILPSVDATGYGLFLFDPVSLVFALNSVYTWDDDLVKGATLIHLYENLMEGRISSEKYLDMLLHFIQQENNEQLLTLCCQQLNTVFWRFSTPQLRQEKAPELEVVLERRMKEQDLLSVNKMLIKTWSEIVSSSEGIKKLKKLVLRKTTMAGVKLSERDLSTMAFNLVMKDEVLDDAFLLSLAEDVKDEDVKGKMIFISPLFSKDESVRDEFVLGLQKLENRKKENWVLTAMEYIFHPFHQEANLKYLNGILSLTPTIKETGSLFFPMRWVEEALSGYSSEEALQTVDYFFKDNPQFPEDLKAKVIQSLDMVERSNKIIPF